MTALKLRLMLTKLTLFLITIFSLGATARTPQRLDPCTQEPAQSTTLIRCGREKAKRIEPVGWDRKRGFPPGAKPRACDPVDQIQYDGVIVGEQFKSDKLLKVSSLFDGYDYARYVTFYHAHPMPKEPIREWKAHHQSCGETGTMWASWEETHSYTVSLTAGISAKKLGLNLSLEASAEVSQSITGSRTINANADESATHVPYEYFNQWEGRTYIQMYNTTTGQTKLLTKFSELTTSGLDSLLYKKYPYRFSLTKQNMTVLVCKENTYRCSTPLLRQ